MFLGFIGKLDGETFMWKPTDCEVSCTKQYKKSDPNYERKVIKFIVGNGSLSRNWEAFIKKF